MASEPATSVGSRGWLYRPEFPEHWERRSLYALAEWVNGLAFRDIQFSPSGRPVIKIAEIKGGISGQTSFTDQVFDDSVHVLPGDLLFAWSGQPETSIDVSWWRGPEGWLNQHIFRVTPSQEVDRTFFYYLLRYLRPNFVGIARNKQTTGLGHVTRRDLESIEAAFPSLPEQRAIAHILGTLDDKIELNRRTNETLEAIARALFKSWFVDFDPVRAKSEGRDPGIPPHLADLFPDSFEDSELGEIPAGWGTLHLGDLLVLDKGLSYKGQFLGETGMPMVNLGCFLGRGRFAGTAMKHYSGEFRDRHVVRPRDLVIANTDLTQKREVIGSPALIPPQGSLGELLFTHHVFAARFRDGQEPWKLFVYFLLLQEEFRERAAGFATGTTVLALPRDAILSLRSAAPPSALIGAFGSIAFSAIERQWRALDESTTLTAVRDTLLPKLVSGELRLKGAERLVEAASA
jgi:type I restriction enzyme S subunit